MCGIAGLVQNSQVEKTLLEKMGDTMQYRGPDGRGLYIEGGMGYNREKYDLVAADDSLGYRLAHNFEHHLTSKSKVWHNATVTGPSDETDNYVLKAELGVQSNIAGNLSLKSVLRDTYTNEPIFGNKKNDITLSTFLVYSF